MGGRGLVGVGLFRLVVRGWWWRWVVRGGRVGGFRVDMSVPLAVAVGGVMLWDRAGPFEVARQVQRPARTGEAIETQRVRGRWPRHLSDFQRCFRVEEFAEERRVGPSLSRRKNKSSENRAGVVRPPRPPPAPRLAETGRGPARRPLGCLGEGREGIAARGKITHEFLTKSLAELQCDPPIAAGRLCRGADQFQAVFEVAGGQGIVDGFGRRAGLFPSAMAGRRLRAARECRSEAIPRTGQEERDEVNGLTGETAFRRRGHRGRLGASRFRFRPYARERKRFRTHIVGPCAGRRRFAYGTVACRGHRVKSAGPLLGK